MQILSLNELIRDQKAKFQHYQCNELIYKTENDFEFPVPINDTGDGMFKAEDKAIFFMRWIKRHREFLLECLAESKFEQLLES